METHSINRINPLRRPCASFSTSSATVRLAGLLGREMAGDWLPMRLNLATDPAVIFIASETDLSEDTVVGKLHRLWSWANEHCDENGNAVGVTLSFIDRYIGVSGFAQAMEKRGWLRTQNDCITFPNFDRWNGKSAKTRLKTAIRVSKSREKVKRFCNDGSVTKALPEKRREEKRKKNTSYSSPDGVPPPDSKQRKQREPDPIWDAVVGLFYADGVPPSQRSRVGKFVSDLKVLGATDDEIRSRFQRYREQWPNIECTPKSLIDHWSRFGASSTLRPSEKEREMPLGRLAAPPGKYDNLPKIIRGSNDDVA